MHATQLRLPDPGTSTSSTTLYYVYGDNLGSADVTADSNNRDQEVTDYSPYGNISNHDQLAGYTEERKFTGQEYDSTTNYMNARYQDPVRGQFISEDRAVVNLGSSQDLLRDPQQLNFYSYGRDNPIRYTDPTGDLTQTQGNAIASVFAAFQATTPQQQAALNGLTVAFVNSPAGLGGGGSSGSSVGYAPSSSAVSSNGTSGNASAPPAPIFSYVPSAVSTPPTIGNIYGAGWGDPRTLQKHFADHGDDFGAKNPAG
jgi:RHS repeat-associated protein